MVKESEYIKQLKIAVKNASWFKLPAMRKEICHLLQVIDSLLNKKPVPMIPNNLLQKVFKIKRLSRFQKSLKDSRSYIFKLQRFELIPHQIDLFLMKKDIERRLKHPFMRKSK